MQLSTPIKLYFHYKDSKHINVLVDEEDQIFSLLCTSVPYKHFRRAISLEDVKNSITLNNIIAKLVVIRYTE